MEITLTPDIENALAKQVCRQRTTLEMLALDTLRERFIASVVTESPAEEQKTLSDFIAGHIGVLSSSEHINYQCK